MNSVLLIDDDIALRTMLAELLAQEGWQVLQADDGEAGIRLAREHQPTAVICDLLMPRCNGYQVCRTLRSEPGLRHTRIIVVSGRNYATDKLNALEAGADQYLVKPVSSADLRQAIEHPIGKSEGIPADTTRRSAFGGSDVPNAALHATNETTVQFWGVRGSIASPGPATVFYGGNTSCVEVRAQGEIVVLDAGTGIRPLGLSLINEFGKRAIKLTVLLTHTHWDHIQGFPFFAPAYLPGNTVRILGYEGARQGLAATLGKQMESPYFPIGLDDVPASIEIEELRDMQFRIGAIPVQARFVNHPGICAGYRLNTAAGAVVFIPDNEPFHRLRERHGGGSAAAQQYADAEDERLVEFIRGARVLIMDAQYDREEYARHVGWGHTCVDDVIDLAIRGGVEQVYLFHHDPAHDDETISRMLAHARAVAARAGSSLQVESAREGLKVTLAALKR